MSLLGKLTGSGLWSPTIKTAQGGSPLSAVLSTAVRTLASYPKVSSSTLPSGTCIRTERTRPQRPPSRESGLLPGVDAAGNVDFRESNLNAQLIDNILKSHSISSILLPSGADLIQGAEQQSSSPKALLDILQKNRHTQVIVHATLAARRNSSASNHAVCLEVDLQRAQDRASLAKLLAHPMVESSELRFALGPLEPPVGAGPTVEEVLSQLPQSQEATATSSTDTV